MIQSSLLASTPLYPSAKEYLAAWVENEPSFRYQWTDTALLAAWVALPLLLFNSTAVCATVAYCLTIPTAAYAGWRYFTQRRMERIEPIATAEVALYINTKFKEWIRIVIKEDKEERTAWRAQHKEFILRVNRLYDRIRISQYACDDSIRFFELKKACEHFFTPAEEIVRYWKALENGDETQTFTDVRVIINEVI